MKDQHTKIKGYRDLSQQEIDLMNKIKEHGENLELLLKELYSLSYNELSDEQVDQRVDCLSYATKDLKQGIMWAVRAVALPNSF